MIDAKRGRITVVGAANIDIGGFSDRRLIQKDSNPGRVYITRGGVGRNIAHNLGLLGEEVAFLTALGDDSFARDIIGELEAASVDLSLTELSNGVSTNIYCYICDTNGDMSVAVCDTGACEILTVPFLSRRKEALGRSKLVVADTNMSAEVINWLIENLTAPLLIDPVSVTKAKRLPERLNGVYAVKPNAIEAQAMTGVEIKERQDCQKACEILLDCGVERVFITLGADGVWCAEKGSHCWLPNLSPRLTGATGAGDAFTAALAVGYIDGAPLADCARLGLAAAAVACESREAVNPEMSRSRLIEKVHEYGGNYCER